MAVLAMGGPASAADPPPENLPGCVVARDRHGLDPRGTIWTWRCALGVAARVWIKEGGWPDAEAAFAEAFARMPEIDNYWHRREHRSFGPLELNIPGAFVAGHAGERKYRSLRGPTKTWLVPAGERPDILFEATWEVSERDAPAEASRVLNLLLAAMRVLPAAR